MIPVTLNFATRLDRTIIYPLFKLYSYNLDTNNGGDTWADIIAGTYSQTPVDLTSFVTTFNWSYDQLAVSMVDDGELSFHPDGGALRRTIQQGRGIRLQEGLEGLATSEWIWTFSGQIEGTYSWVYTRADSINIGFTAFNRGNNQAWKRRNVTGKEFTVGADWSAPFMDISKTIMGLEDNEVAVTEPWNLTLDKNSNQIVNIPPWEALEDLLLGVNETPWFNGKGQLASYKTTQDRVTVTLPNDEKVNKYEMKAASTETINKIIFTYIDNQLSRVDGQHQLLGSAMVTTGFFRPYQNMDVWWSDDHRQRASGITMRVIQSVNDSLLPIGHESLQFADEFHGRVHVSIFIYTSILVVGLLVIYAVLASRPEAVQVGPTGTGATIPSTKTWFEIIALVLILIIMMSMGTGQYELWGTPYDMVYLEKQYIAMKDGLNYWDEREKEINNQFVSLESMAKVLALNALYFEVMKENPRTMTLKYDPRYEPGDIIQFANGVKFYVEQARKTVRRGSSDPVTIELSGYRCVL